MVNKLQSVTINLMGQFMGLWDHLDESITLELRTASSLRSKTDAFITTIIDFLNRIRQELIKDSSSQPGDEYQILTSPSVTNMSIRSTKISSPQLSPRQTDSTSEISSPISPVKSQWHNSTIQSYFIWIILLGLSIQIYPRNCCAVSNCYQWKVSRQASKVSNRVPRAASSILVLLGNKLLAGWCQDRVFGQNSCPAGLWEWCCWWSRGGCWTSARTSSAFRQVTS